MVDSKQRSLYLQISLPKPALVLNRFLVTFLVIPDWAHGEKFIVIFLMD